MRPSRSALAATAMVVMVLVGLVLVGRLSAGGLRSSGPPAVSTESRQAAPPPRSTTPSPVTLRLPLGRVDALAVQGDAVWAAHGCVISRVDARSGRVVAAVRLTPTRIGCFVVGMAAGAGALWVSLSGQRLLRVDPTSNRVVASLAMADPLAAPAVTAGGVWTVCCWSGVATRHPAGWLVRVDPASTREAARVRLPGLPTAVGAGPGGIWVTGAGGPIWRVDPAGGRVVATVAVPGGLGGLPGRTGRAGEVGDVLVGPHAVWVSNPARGQVLRVDPARNRLVRAAVFHRGELIGPSLAAAGGQVWATSWTILWALGTPGRQADLDQPGVPGAEGAEPISDLAASPGALWVGASDVLLRVDLARLR